MDGKAEGPWRFFHPDGSEKAAGSYRRGDREGPWIFRHPGGALWLQGTFEHGLQHGRFTAWHPNGTKKSEGVYIHGKKEGLWVFWHPSGVKAQEGRYQDGVQDGPWTTWWPNGAKRFEAVLRAGRKVGRFRIWSPDGTLLRESVAGEEGIEGPVLTLRGAPEALLRCAQRSPLDCWSERPDDDHAEPALVSGASVDFPFEPSMNEIDRLIDELQRAFDGDPWHGSSTMAILKDVTATMASARPIKTAHSIWEVVLHMAAWTGEVRRRLEGGEPRPPEEGDWPSMPAPADETRWQKTLSELGSTRAALLGALRSFPASRLDDLLGPTRDASLGTGSSFALMLHGLSQHDAYHSGQIALLKKAAAR